jgi:hypothetical protein
MAFLNVLIIGAVVFFLLMTLYTSVTGTPSSQMSPKVIAIGAVIVMLLIILWNMFYGSNSTELSQTQDATILKTIEANTIKANNSTNFAYSGWIFVDDWTYKYGSEKIILSRLDKALHPCPQITLAPYQNELVVTVQTYPDSTNASPSVNSQIHTCTVKNVPIQSWVHIAVSVHGRSLDVYLDGKLVKTCVMPGVAKVDQTANIGITPNGGFSGYTSKIFYYPTALNPQEVWDLYAEGYGGSSFASIANRYKLKVALLEDEVEKRSFSI